VLLIGKQRHKRRIAGESSRAGQDPQRVSEPITIIILIIIIIIINVVGIATSYGLRNRISSPGGVKNLLLSQIVQTGSGFHQTSYPMVPGALSPGVKRPGREADHSPPTSAEVKKMWMYSSTLPYAFMVYC
jgi:hypothetical protein